MIRVFSFLLLAAMAHGQARLAGRWRTIETSKGGIGALYEFHDDGTFNFGPGAVVEMKYRIEGDQLILPPSSVNGPEQRQTVTWTEARDLILTMQGASRTLSRQGAVRDADNPIVGEWVVATEMDGRKLESRFLFERDGKVLLLMPFTVQQGKYTVKGATIRLEYPKEPPVEGPFRIEGDVLTIPTARDAARLRRY